MTRVLAGQLLTENPVRERRRLLEAVRILAPQDRLLARDCDRFGRDKPAPKKPVTRRNWRVKPIEPVRAISLPAGVTWMSAALAPPLGYFAGWFDNAMMVLVGNLGDSPVNFEKFHWQRSSQADAPIVLQPWGGRIVVGVPGDERDFRRQAVLQEGPGRTRRIEVGPPPLGGSLFGAAASPSGNFWSIIEGDGDFVVSGVNAEGSPLASRHFPAALPLFDLNPFPNDCVFPMHARDDGVFVGMGQVLHVMDGRGRSHRSIDVGQPIVSLCGPPPRTRRRVALGFPRGAAVVWQEFGSEHQKHFARNLERPCLAFCRSGGLVVAADGCLQVYETAAHEVRFVADLEEPSLQPFAVLPLEKPDEFLVCNRDGRLQVYRCTKGPV